MQRLREELDLMLEEQRSKRGNMGGAGGKYNKLDGKTDRQANTFLFYPKHSSSYGVLPKNLHLWIYRF